VSQWKRTSPLRSRTDTVALKSWVLYYETEKPVRELYELLKAYYLNNGLYDQLYSALTTVGAETQAMRPLRNPAYRAVEFYAAKLWPGPLPDALKIVTENDRLPEAIKQLWTWSNWSVMKQRTARWGAMYGDVFIKVEKPKKDRVYLSLIEPTYVTELDADERGFLTYVRIDIPQQVREEDKTKLKTYTEVWDKASDSLRIWVHDRDAETDLSLLGDPKSYSISSELRVDFLPIVQAKLRDIGEDRGLGCFTQSIDKIDEANRMATRLHQNLWRYNVPIWALRANQVTPDGRPMPPPILSKNANDELELGGDKMIPLPGNTQLESLVPNISWSDALSVLQDHMTELEHDLPELAYWRMREIGELSGRAVQLLLGDAIDKLLEARGNMESALVRANQMALTIGSKFQLFDVGLYENGDLEHSFEAREVIPTPELERAQTVQTYISAKVAKESTLRRAGWTEDDIAKEKKQHEEEVKEQQEQFERNQLASERAFDRGVENPADKPGQGNED